MFTVLSMINQGKEKEYYDFSLRFETCEYFEKNYDSELRVRKTDTGPREKNKYFL